jgi:hypothetical protein
MITTSATPNLSTGGSPFSVRRMCFFFASALCCVLSLLIFVFAYAVASRHRTNDYMAAFEFSLRALGLQVGGVILRFAGTGHIQLRSVGRFPGVSVLIRSLAFAFGIELSCGALNMLKMAFLLHNRMYLHWFEFDWPQVDTVPADASKVTGCLNMAFLCTAVASFLLWAALRGIRFSRRCD